MRRIDLHTHTLHSDGTASVAQVLEMAQQLGLNALAISDHNAVDGYRQLAGCRHLFSGKIIPAVELTTAFQGEVVEVLGYGIDTDQMAEYVSVTYPDNNTRRIQEAGLITRALLDKGVRLGEKLVQILCTDPERIDPGFHHIGCRPFLLEEMRKFPENALFFKNESEFSQINATYFARNYLLNPRSALYVDTTVLFPPMAQVIERIHGAGGLAFLAHPFIYSPAIVACLEHLIAAYELDGLECHYGTFTPEQKQFMTDFCDKHGLYKSGGSDFHGLDARPNNPMGRSAGVPIPETLIEPWLGKVTTI
ncbi:MAG: PHP domain-containing protein [Clostridia bacterium]|nr:PHP domain-containing protein [Clostridia bacterium]